MIKKGDIMKFIASLILLFSTMESFGALVNTSVEVEEAKIRVEKALAKEGFPPTLENSWKGFRYFKITPYYSKDRPQWNGYGNRPIIY